MEMWPVDPDECMLTIKEKLLIEEYLLHDRKDDALRILKNTWRFIMTYEPKHRNIPDVINAIKEVVQWIKSGGYKEHEMYDPPKIETDKYVQFWDFVCDNITGYTDTHLFDCESRDEAELFLKEFKEHVTIPGFGLTVVERGFNNQVQLNMFKIHNSPSQSNQSSPSEPQKC